MDRFRIHPKAVCKQLIAVIEDKYKPLSNEDQRRVLFAIENTGLPVSQVLASMSKTALQAVVDDL